MRALTKMVLLAGVGTAVWAPSLSGQVVLSEFQASNAGTLKDEDGDSSDWIELSNTSDAPLNLGEWSLTDDPERLTKWQLPSTNLAAGGFLVVFASGKDRRIPGNPLHANFKLSADGEYLALVKPGGEIATAYSSSYPPQADGLSYGLPVMAQQTTLLPTGAPGRFLVPADDALGTAWTFTSFDHSQWLPVRTGVGFAGSGSPVSSMVNSDVAGLMRTVNASAYLRLPFVASNLAELRALALRVRFTDGFIAYLNGVPIASRNAPVAAAGGIQADSVADWSGDGRQGFKNWFYGFFNQGSDLDGIFDPDTDFDYTNAQWGWNGAAWVLGPSNPPWDTISVTGWRPNGTNSGDVHWPIRRWISSTAGAITCRIEFAKENPECGSGATLRVLQNGVERFQCTAASDDSECVRINVVLDGIQEGDYVDFALDPMGADGKSSDLCDSATFTVVIDQEPAEGPTWHSSATAIRSPTQASVAEEINLARSKDLLIAGTNVLAVHALNDIRDDPHFLILPELTSVQVRMDPGERAYFTEPTPGYENGPGESNLGPIVGDVIHAPKTPGAGEDLVVRARVQQSLRPLASVTLNYSIMFGNEGSVVMHDDGQAGDDVARDSVYAARLPVSAARPGQMIRYYLRVSDTAGNVSRAPAYADPSGSPQYFGTVVLDPSLTNSRLPVLHWFLQKPTAADTDLGARCSLFFEGEFYDNVLADAHGQSTRTFPKKSYDLHFNSGSKFRWSPDAPKVKSLNLLTTWADKTHMRSVLAYETYRDAGAASHFAFPVRVQRNGAFFGVANMVESGDQDFLERVGLDPQGALYKMYNSAENIVSAEKKSRKHEGTEDLQAFVNAMNQPDSDARQTYMFDHLDIPAVVNFLAAKIITADVDCCHKNYYLYRDSDGSGEWQAMPWDVDLSFGRVWTCGDPCWQYFDETIYSDQPINVGAGNRVFRNIYETSFTRKMFLRRLRTLMDELLQAPGTTPAEDFYRIKTIALRDEIAADAELDLAKWGTWGNRETIDEAVARIWNEFLPARRSYLFLRMLVSNRGEIPLAQPPDAKVEIQQIEYRAASGNPLEEWLSLTNANSFAVDLSNWQLVGGVDYVFRPGTVIPGRAALFVSPNARAFRGRQASPRGGEQRLVVGPYSGNLSARGETVALKDTHGRLVSTRSFAGDPSLAQQFLRITEIFFNPDPIPATPGLDAQKFEFVELRNIGPTTLDLRGVRFTKGVQFDFRSGAITQLAPGARLLVVSDTNAFALRYGTGLPVAGAFIGSLDSAGEMLRIDDAFGDEILEFEYDDRWYPATDGSGYSLVINGDTLRWDSWGLKESWRPSAVPGGTPGTAEDTPVNPILNQVLVECVPSGYRLRYGGTPGRICEIQRSLDLTVWHKVAERSIAPDGTLEHIEPFSTDPAAYYRILEW